MKPKDSLAVGVEQNLASIDAFSFPPLLVLADLYSIMTSPSVLGVSGCGLDVVGTN